MNASVRHHNEKVHKDVMTLTYLIVREIHTEQQEQEIVTHVTYLSSYVNVISSDTHKTLKNKQNLHVYRIYFFTAG